MLAPPSPQRVKVTGAFRVSVPCHRLVPQFETVSGTDPVSIHRFGCDGFPRIENRGTVFGDDSGEIGKVDAVHGQRRDLSPGGMPNGVAASVPSNRFSVPDGASQRVNDRVSRGLDRFRGC